MAFSGNVTCALAVFDFSKKYSRLKRENIAKDKSFFQTPIKIVR